MEKGHLSKLTLLCFNFYTFSFLTYLCAISQSMLPFLIKHWGKQEYMLYVTNSIYIVGVKHPGVMDLLRELDTVLVRNLYSLP